MVSLWFTGKMLWFLQLVNKGLWLKTYLTKFSMLHADGTDVALKLTSDLGSKVRRKEGVKLDSYLVRFGRDVIPYSWLALNTTLQTKTIIIIIYFTVNAMHHAWYTQDIIYTYMFILYVSLYICHGSVGRSSGFETEGTRSNHIIGKIIFWNINSNDWAYKFWFSIELIKSLMERHDHQ